MDSGALIERSKNIWLIVYKWQLSSYKVCYKIQLHLYYICNCICNCKFVELSKYVWDLFDKVQIHIYRVNTFVIQSKYICDTEYINLWYSANTMVERWSLGQALPPHMRSSEKSCAVWEVRFLCSTIALYARWNTNTQLKLKKNTECAVQGVIPGSGPAASYTELQSETPVTTGPLPHPLSTLLTKSSSSLMKIMMMMMMIMVMMMMVMMVMMMSPLGHYHIHWALF